jgi:hypothetical protein
LKAVPLGNIQLVLHRTIAREWIGIIAAQSNATAAPRSFAKKNPQRAGFSSSQGARQLLLLLPRLVVLSTLLAALTGLLRLLAGFIALSALLPWLVPAGLVLLLVLVAHGNPPVVGIKVSTAGSHPTFRNHRVLSFSSFLLFV